MAAINNISTKPLRIMPIANVTVLTATTQMREVRTLKNIHGLYLMGTVAGAGITLANWIHDVHDVHVTIGGQVVIDHMTPQELMDKWNYYMTKDAAIVPAGILPIMFVPGDFIADQECSYFRYGMKASADPADMTALSLNIEITYLAVVLVADRVRPFIVVDDDAPETLGDHVRWTKRQSTFAGTGKEDITDVKRAGPRLMRSLWFPTSTGTIITFDVIEGSDYRYRDVPIDLMQFEQRSAGFIPQANVEVLAWNLRNAPGSALALDQVESVTVAPNWSVTPAGVYTIIQELVYRGL